MKNLEKFNKADQCLFPSIGIIAFIILLAACKNEKVEKESIENIPEVASNIEITTEAMEFQGPDTIPSGWVTWRYKNNSTQPHFILIDDNLDSITVKEFRDELLPPFGEGVQLMYEGNNEAAMQAFGKIPEWYSKTTWPGGVGMISGGETAQTTLYLEPGYYIMECYVKMANGMFHTNMGMYKALVVSEEVSPMEEPKADVAVTISSEGGIEFEPPKAPGTYNFSVHFKDQKKYANFQSHDVNLVRIEEGAEVAVIENWMNWMNLDGLIDPVPDGFTFLGGVNDMPAGKTGYFTATIKPGTYALISEVPEASSKGMLKVFTCQ
ncbi:MAG: hypothetical protein R3359_02430 [Marinirhabdus sp.]|nr:hypothetical protein [Marinirhabdus sp.]